MLRREVNYILESCRSRSRYAYFELTHWPRAVFGFSEESFECVAERISALSPAPERVLHLRPARADARDFWGAGGVGCASLPKQRNCSVRSSAYILRPEGSEVVVKCRVGPSTQLGLDDFACQTLSSFRTTSAPHRSHEHHLARIGLIDGETPPGANG